MNKIIFTGYLGRDPEQRFTPGGTAVTSFSVANSRKYTGGDGQPVTETTWYQVSAFGKQAEACAKYLKKGSKVLIEGRLSPDPKTGSPRVFQRQEGTAGAAYDIVASVVEFLDRPAEGAAPEEEAPPEDSDVPF